MRTRYGRGMVVVAALFFLLPLASLVCLALPFRPYHTYNFVAVPRYACPAETLRIQVDRDVHAPAWARMYDAKISSYWENIDTEDRIGNASVSLPIEETPEGMVESPVLRTAPAIPGDYRLSSRVVASGSVGFMPRQQTVETSSPEPITVLAPQDERCKGGAWTSTPTSAE